MFYEKNKSPIFKVIKNFQVFPSNVYHFQYVHRFLFSTEMWNIRTCTKIRLQKLVKFRLSEQYSFWYCQVADK